MPSLSDPTVIKRSGSDDEQYDAIAGLIETRLGRPLKRDEAARLASLVDQRAAMLTCRRTLLRRAVGVVATQRGCPDRETSPTARAVRAVDRLLGLAGGAGRLSPDGIVAQVIGQDERR